MRWRQSESWLGFRLKATPPKVATVAHEGFRVLYATVAYPVAAYLAQKEVPTPRPARANAIALAARSVRERSARPQ